MTKNITNNFKCIICGKEINNSSTEVIVELKAGGMAHASCVLDIAEGLNELYNEISFEDTRNINSIDKEEIKEQIIQTPKEIEEVLLKNIIGQDKAIRNIAIFYWKHLMTTAYNSKHNNQLKKSNIFIPGPTGCGKTEIFRVLSKHFDIPMYIQDVTSLTAAGFVGQDIDECVKGLIEAADGDISKAERGIIFLDEIDKISAKGESTNTSKSGVGREDVQQGLLKIIEGHTIAVTGRGERMHPTAETIEIDTSNILFIASGSFPGIEDIVKRRLNKSSLGINTKVEKLTSFEDLKEVFENITNDDLKKFGMIPEFLGRFSLIEPILPLDFEDLKRVLTEPEESPVNQFSELINEVNHSIAEFTPECLNYIAESAIELKTGARSLFNILNQITADFLYNLDSNTRVKVTFSDKGKYSIEELPPLEIKPFNQDLTFNKYPVTDGIMTLDIPIDNEDPKGDE